MRLSLWLLTSYDDGGGLLGWVAHVVAGHTAVHAGLAGRDGRQRERAALNNAPLRQAVIAADPGEDGRWFSAGGNAHEGHGLAWVHHDGVLHQELDGRGSLMEKWVREGASGSVGIFQV